MLTEPTSHTLIEMAAAGNEDAWHRINALYRPFVLGWLRHAGVEHHDAEEITQDVLAVMFRELSEFDHSGRLGAFRLWVRRIAFHRVQGYWRSRRQHKARLLSGEFISTEEIAEPDSELSRIWDREHDTFVLRSLLRQVESNFEQQTVEAFRRIAFDGQTPQQVADELKMSPRAVYIAKSRVLRRLKDEARGLVDGTPFE